MLRSPAPRPHGGFTITELLVVVAIMALIAAFLFPILARLRDWGWRTTCLNNVRQLSMAHRLYVQDWDGYFPACVQPGPPRPAPFGPYRYWTEFMQPYLLSTRVLRCPGAVGQRPPVYAPVLAEYALLTWSQGGRRADPEEPYQRWPGPPLTESQVERPAETISLIDGWTTTRWSGESRPRHGGRLIASFVDGHVACMSRKQLGQVEPDDQGRYWLVYGSAHR